MIGRRRPRPAPDTGYCEEFSLIWDYQADYVIRPVPGRIYYSCQVAAGRLQETQVLQVLSIVRSTILTLRLP